MRFTLALFGVFLFLAAPLIHGQDAEKPSPDAKKTPVKKGPNRGTFECTITAGDKTKTFDTPSKAMTEARRSVSRQKRSKDGVDFTASLKLNGTEYTFSDPKSAMDACSALLQANRRLLKLRMGLGDIGDIPAFDPAKVPGADSAKNAAEVRRRIQAALQKSSGGGGGAGGYRRPAPPNPQAIQRTIATELQKARDEGLLPKALTLEERIAAEKEAVIQMLAAAFSKADGNEASAEGGEAKKKEAE